MPTPTPLQPRPWIAAAIVMLAICGCATPTSTSPTRPPWAPEAASGWHAKRGQQGQKSMVAAAHPLAAQAAQQILRDGGSALDAGIAAQMVLNLVEPQSSGIGGGGFLVYHDARTRKALAYDGRETAPAAATESLFLDTNGKPLPFAQAIQGGRAVGVPGLLRMLEKAHRQHGKRPWATLFEPAIALAEKGFEVSPRLHELLARTDFPAAALRTESDAARYFYDSHGQARPVGFLLKNPELASSLRAVAQGGARAFYEGDIANAIVSAIQKHPTNPGVMQTQDLAQYQAQVHPALCGSYRSHTLCGAPPPSSGTLTVLMTLGILENFKLHEWAADDVRTIHTVAEAYRLAYADRAQYIADPAFVTVPTEGLLDQSYLQQRAARISEHHAQAHVSHGAPKMAPPLFSPHPQDPPPGTTHLSIVDADGNALSMTSSIENGFGSLLMVRGFLLNNQLSDFSFSPRANGRKVANHVQANKRPRSSMAPVLVYRANEDSPAIILGSPGGAQIIQYVTQTLLGLIDWKMDIQTAIEQPHFGAQIGPEIVLEAGTPLEALTPTLTERGHPIQNRPMTSGLHGIVRMPSASSDEPQALRWACGADPRREGICLAD